MTPVSMYSVGHRQTEGELPMMARLLFLIVVQVASGAVS